MRIDLYGRVSTQLGRFGVDDRHTPVAAASHPGLFCGCLRMGGTGQQFIGASFGLPHQSLRIEPGRPGDIGSLLARLGEVPVGILLGLRPDDESVGLAPFDQCRDRDLHVLEQIGARIPGILPQSERCPIRIVDDVTGVPECAVDPGFCLLDRVDSQLLGGSLGLAKDGGDALPYLTQVSAQVFDTTAPFDLGDDRIVVIPEFPPAAGGLIQEGADRFAIVSTTGRRQPGRGQLFRLEWVIDHHPAGYRRKASESGNSPHPIGIQPVASTSGSGSSVPRKSRASCNVAIEITCISSLAAVRASV